MKYLVLLSAVLMQMCFGATYSWSVYVQPLKVLTGLQQGPVQIPFTIFYFVFPLVVVITGMLLPRLGPRKCAMVGGLLFGLGWFFASFGANNFFITSLGIGVLAATGAGLGYIIPIPVCIRWFPDNKGLVTGIAVAGFGGGAALVSKIGGWMMTELGKTPFEVFFALGLSFTAITIIAGSFMHFPNKEHKAGPIPKIQLSELLKDSTFQLLYLMMFIGLAAGFSVNANLKELYGGGGKATQIGITGVILFAIANAAGRILWGNFSDKISSAGAILRTNLIAQGLTFITAPFVISSATGFWIISFITGFNYGGVLVLYASSITKKWGAERVGQIYGILFSANVPAAFAPIIAGIIYDITGNFTPTLYLLGAVLMIFSLTLGRRLNINTQQPEAKL